MGIRNWVHVLISSTASMFNADDVKTGTVAVCVCVTVPVLPCWRTYNCLTKNAVSISVSVRRTKEEGSVCLSLPSHKALDLYSHTYTRKSTNTDCVSKTVQWQSFAWVSNHHRLPPPSPLLIPIKWLCECGSSAPPHPPSAIRLSKTPTLPFIQLRVLGIGCVFIFFALG